jgi:PAS domain S-box-containing protein
LDVYSKISIELYNYKDLFEHSQDGIYFSSLDGQILEVNKAFLNITGYKQDEILEVKSLDLYTDPKVREKFQKEILEKGTVRDFEVDLFRKDKAKITCLLTSSVFKNKEGETIGFKGLIKDVTILKAATAALKTSEKRFRVLFDDSPDPIFVEDLKGNILDVNPAACELHNMLYTELIGISVFELVPDKLKNRVKTEFQRMVDGNLRTIESVSKVIQGNREIPVEVNVSRIKYLEQDALLLHVRDITIRKETERDLGEERRKRLSEITEIQEREKKRMARELHDGIGQMLFGAKVQLESLKRKVKSQEKITELVCDIEFELQEIIAATRALSRRLRPSVLDDFGLFPALEQLFEQYQNVAKIQLRNEVMQPSNRYGSKTEVAIYRIVQEAISNAVRHGNSSVICITLAAKNNNIELFIKDNGYGFDTAKQEWGHGLKNISERAESIGGKYEMNSIRGKGAEINVVIPNYYG